MDSIERLAHWRAGVKIAHNSHIETATRYTRLNRYFGIPVVILTAIIGTTVFTSIASTEYSLPLQITAGVLSITAAVLSGVYTFLNYGELAERHRSAAVKYGNLRREIEQVQCFTTQQCESETMKQLRLKWDALDLEAPSIPQDIHDRVHGQVQAQLKQELAKMGYTMT
ncbi:MAG: SLATT domain-containing protein [Candidatus Bathyarchaeota archaeon]|nr:SLATT domain-containing protein [Candidatus Bathyarchaeota archaeon]